MAGVDTVVALHGFAGRGASWDPVAARLGAAGYRCLAPDLHAVRPPSFAGLVAGVLAAAPPVFALAGYSLGARIALQVALAAPGRVSALCLVSGTAGIESEGGRVARAQADDDLADRMAASDDPAALWAALPVFADDPPEARAQQAADIRSHPPAVLRDALRALSTGRMAPLWEDLDGLRMPTLVLAGERDAKYVRLGERLSSVLLDSRLVVVPHAGHGLLREAPAAVSDALIDLLHGR